MKKYNKIMIDKIVVSLKSDAEYKAVDPDEMKALTDYFTAMSRFIRSLNPKCAVECNPGSVDDVWGMMAGNDFARFGLAMEYAKTAHHDLFEGNLAPNIGSDSTHGNSGWQTFFRVTLPLALPGLLLTADLGYLALEPFANLAYVHLDSESFHEKGDAAALQRGIHVLARHGRKCKTRWKRSKPSRWSMQDMR